MANEPTLYRGQLPKGYVFVPKGNVYITGTCRKDAQAAGQTVYLVVNGKDKRFGLGVPSAIYAAVQQKEVQTRRARSANVIRRDNAIKNGFEQVILQVFPRLPRESLPRILEVALQKGVGKVGRTGTLTDHQKAQLAVRAHIRHCHTNYDKILQDARKDTKRMKAKNLARKAVQAQVDAVAASWRSVERCSSPRPAESSSLSKPKGSTRSLPVTTAKPAQTSASVTRRAKMVRVRTKPSPTASRTPSTTHAFPMSGASLPLRPSQPTRRVPVQVIDLTMDSDDSFEDLPLFR